ncbi:MAG: hypothetical protein ACYT04_14445 [Nostoc sp.]
MKFWLPFSQIWEKRLGMRANPLDHRRTTGFKIDVVYIECIRRRLGGAERNPTDYQDVGLRKASTQPTIFLLKGYPIPKYFLTFARTMSEDKPLCVYALVFSKSYMFVVHCDISK